MSTQESPATTPPQTLRPLSRFITTHNSTGQAIFSTALSEIMPTKGIPDGATFSLAYTSEHFPARLANDADIPAYAKYLDDAPGLVISTGNVCRIVDMQPGALSPMHRTVSLDYGVVLEGEVELVLDSGETRLLRRGDVAVQRGTNHAWRNVTPDVVGEDGVVRRQWARMLYVLTPCEEVKVGGERLGEDLAGMGVRAST